MLASRSACKQDSLLFTPMLDDLLYCFIRIIEVGRIFVYYYFICIEYIYFAYKFILSTVMWQIDRLMNAMIVVSVSQSLFQMVAAN